MMIFFERDDLIWSLNVKWLKIPLNKKEQINNWDCIWNGINEAPKYNIQIKTTIKQQQQQIKAKSKCNGKGCETPIRGSRADIKAAV